MKNPFEHDVVAGPHQYRPDWDVLELNAEATEKLKHAVERARVAGAKTDRKIPLLLGTPGHGKTHLFGRLTHQFEGEILTIFVPQVEDPDRPMEHLRRAIVESLFRKVGESKTTPLERLLSQFCHESFRCYFQSLPASLRAEHRQVGLRLESQSDEVLRIVRRVTSPLPFLSLAKSLADMPGFNGIHKATVKALALGWAPQIGQLARRWLRGEELAQEDWCLLKLGGDDLAPPDPPTAKELLHALSLLSERRPIVVCFDQMEAVLAKPNGIKNLSNELVGLLHDQDLHNLVLVASCLEDSWNQLPSAAGGAFQMFDDRTEEITLARPTTAQVRSLLRNRLRSWPDRKEGSDELWPFDLATLDEWAQKESPSPRGLLSTCSKKFREWQEDGQEGLIQLGQNGKLPAADLMSVWQAEMTAIQTDDDRGLENLDEVRFNNAIQALLEVVPKQGDSRPSEWMIDEIGDAGLSTGSTRRENARITLVNGSGESRQSIYLLSTTQHKGSWNYNLKAMRKALQQDVSERTLPVIIYPGKELPLSANGQTLFNSLEADFGLTTILLGTEATAYEEVECFYSLMTECRRGDLQQGTTTITKDAFTKFIVEDLKLTRHNKLLATLLTGSTVREAEQSKPVLSSKTAVAVEGSSSSVNKTASKPKQPSTTKPIESSSTDGLVEKDPFSEVEQWANELLISVCKELQLFNLNISPLQSHIGPRFARLIVKPHGKTTIAQVRNKAEDLKARLDSIPQTPMIDSHPEGISIDVELPKRFRAVVSLDDMLATRSNDDNFAPLFPVGQDVAGRSYWADLSDSNHAHYLIAGTTGSGKSEFLKALMAGLAIALPPERLRFILIDPKRVTFNLPGSSPYLGVNGRGQEVIYTAADARPILRWCAEETDRRYEFLARHNLSDVSQASSADVEAPPRLVVICDEFADLMSDAELKKELDQSLQKMASKARAAGIHLVLATQRPDKDVFSMQVRSNLPGRVCLRVASAADSRIVLESTEAADLLGKGDLLWKDGIGKLRLQSPLVDSGDLCSALRIAEKP